MHRKNVFLWLGICLVAGLLLSMPARSGEAENEGVSIKTERVIVFKDGHCLFIKRVAGITNAQGELCTDKVPGAAVLGTFWGIPQTGELLGISSDFVEKEETEKKEETCSQVAEILSANLRRPAEVEMHNNKTYSGIIQEVLAPTGQQAAYFILRTKESDQLLAVGQVQRLQIEGMKSTFETSTTTTRKTKQLTFRFAKAGAQCEALLLYLSPGIRWIPTYRVDLAATKGKTQTAAIAMQAEILNESEDLDGVPVDLIVGVPHFRFKTTISPMSLEAAIRNTLEETAPQLMAQQVSANMFTNRASEFSRMDRQDRQGQNPAPVTLPQELTAAGSQDLFVYNLPKLSLKKGGRICMPILAAQVPYRDVYTWELAIKRKPIEGSPSGKGIAAPLTLSDDRIWRQVELTNNTNLPWTTGAVMFMDGNMPLAQEMLSYTSAGSAVRVPVTVAVDVHGSFEESEAGREMNAEKWDSYTYMRVKKTGRLQIVNRKNTPIDLEVRYKIGGRTTEASHDGVITLSAFSRDDWDEYTMESYINNSSVVRWTLHLTPQEQLNPEVTSEYFVRQR